MKVPQPPKDPRVLQDLLGQGLIDLIKTTTRNDLEVAQSYETGLFAHVSEAKTRKALAQIMFETRWLYKLGLTLVVENEEQTAHVRAQILGYGGVCEGLLLDAFHHGLDKGALSGHCWKHWDPPGCTKPMNKPTTRRRDFFKLNEIAREEGIISQALYNTIDSLRKDRNTIHAKALAVHSISKFYVPKGKKFFQAVIDTAKATEAWKAKHP